MNTTRRAVALLLTGEPAVGACPPGVAPDRFARALAEDVADLLADLPGIDAAVAASAARKADAEAVRWPGTPVLDLPEGAGPLAVLAALADDGYDEAAVVAPDVPDLPGLIVAKPFSGLATAQVAAAPAAGGDGLVVLACRLPVPAWLAEAGVDLDTPDALGVLRSAAPRRRDLALAPAWGRLRTPADLSRLDPGLEGWDATRALLQGS